jgi:hypothetical protein
MSEIKKINIVFKDPKEVLKEKNEPKKRSITKTTKWAKNTKNVSHEDQIKYIKEICEDTIQNPEICSIMIQQIKQKINGYHNQDVIKKILNEDKFVDFKYVIDLIRDSNLNCFYCRQSTFVLYENVREMKQWSLERIENQYGHNKENVEIACLSCNLGRRTMYHERYLFTKQLEIIKKDA